VVQGDYSHGRDGMSGKYQTTDNLEELIANWQPSDMLPRNHKDKRQKPKKIKGLREGLL
jgi:hypothetical protein